MSKVTKDEIKKIADLAKLKFSDQELNSFVDEFSSILDYISQISECDTSGIQSNHFLDNYIGEVFQADIPKLSLEDNDIFLNAKKERLSGRYFKTSKVVNKD